MSRRHRRDRQRDEYGQSWEMAAALWDGPRAELLELGWLVGDERLSVTDAGREHLSRGMRRTRGEKHRLFAGGRVHGRRWYWVPEETERVPNKD